MLLLPLPPPVLLLLPLMMVLVSTGCCWSSCVLYVLYSLPSYPPPVSTATAVKLV